jgi:cobaltochelatase CobN
VALAENDAADVLLGDLPNPYIYIMDGGGEAIQAKRRAAATIVSHLTPLIVPAGEIAEFEPLHQVLDQWEKVGEAAAELRAEYQRQARQFIAEKGLDRQLQVDLAKSPWEEIRHKVHVFLHELEDHPIPAGIAALGQLPDKGLIEEAAAHLKQTGVPDAEAERWMAALRESPGRELNSVAAVLEGKFVPSGLMGDPLKTPSTLPSGRNLHAFDANLIPTKAACAVGKRLGEETLERYRREQGRPAEKLSLVLFYGETESHQGAMECMALWLLGVEPIWNSRGLVETLRLIPLTELKRPRVDVLATFSGIYRDGFPDKALLLDQAVRLAAGAEGGETIRRHDAEVARSLQEQGVAPETAARLGRARLFASKPGAYGISLVKMVEQSRNFQNEAAMAQLYHQSMNHAFSAETWGEGVPGVLERHLKGNDAVIFSRSSNLYGALDNDDTYAYAGGLSLVTKRANGGQAPRFYIQNHRRAGRESTTDMKTWLASELNARGWNPKWLRHMQQSGYAGAREMFREVEHLYGFQATAREQMDATFWQNTYDVYVADRHKLGMQTFFQRENPHAEQMLVARLLEVDRQGVYTFTATERRELLRRYVESVNRDGISCAANTCGNRELLSHIQRQARPVLTGSQLTEFERQIRHATERVVTAGEPRLAARAPGKMSDPLRRALWGDGVRWVDSPMPSFDPVKAMRVSLVSVAVLAGLWLVGITGVWSRVRRGEALTVRSLLR